MKNLLLKVIMVSIFMWITFSDKYVTQFFTYRSIIAGPIAGAIIGDINIGLQVGCTIELMFLGQVFVGTALPPEETFSTGVAATFVCISGSQQLAFVMALSLAILGQVGMYFRNMTLYIWIQHRAEAAVERGNKIGTIMNTQAWPNIFSLVLFVTPTFMATYFGADATQATTDAVPRAIIDGLTVGDGMAGAVRLALLLQSINARGIWYHSIIGFFFSSFLKIGNVGTTLVAVVCIAMTYYNDNKQEA